MYDGPKELVPINSSLRVVEPGVPSAISESNERPPSATGWSPGARVREVG